MPTALAGPCSVTSRAGRRSSLPRPLTWPAPRCRTTPSQGSARRPRWPKRSTQSSPRGAKCSSRATSRWDRPLAATVIDASGDDRLRQAARALLDQWRDSVRAALVKFGVHESTAQDDASVLLAALEGALILSRANQSTQPLDTVQRFFTNSLTQTADHPAAPPPVAGFTARAAAPDPKVGRDQSRFPRTRISCRRRSRFLQQAVGEHDLDDRGNRSTRAQSR